MATIEETRNIHGYFDDSAFQAGLEVTWAGEGAKSLAEILDEEIHLRRWPVRNREERTRIDSHKRAIIHERDGHICRMCGIGGVRLTVDHIVPRSAFRADSLHIADRSDNLISACWDCNMDKSNYEHPQPKRMGVVRECWDCANPWHDPEYYLDDLADSDPRPATPVLVYCGRCGITNGAPAVDGWVL